MKKKIFIPIICFVVLILLIIFLCLFVFQKKESKKPKKDYGTLIEISYSCSGDMLGNIYEVDVSIPYKEVTIKESNAHNDPITESRYRLTDTKTLDEIEKIIKAYDLPSLDNSPIDDEYFVYDACSPNISLKYRVGRRSYDNEYYNISFYAKMSDTERKELGILEKNIYKLINSDNLLSTKTVERD